MLVTQEMLVIFRTIYTVKYFLLKNLYYLSIIFFFWRDVCSVIKQTTCALHAYHLSVISSLLLSDYLFSTHSLLFYSLDSLDAK